MDIEVAKVVLLGEAGVGKTCLIKQFTENKFDNTELSSLSAQYVSKTIDYLDTKKAIKFDIWDTVGQERFRSIAKIFYKDARVILFVYDITSKKTFDALINFWYEELRNDLTENPIYAVVGNKNDLYMNQQVDTSDAKDLAKNLGGIFQLTSAKTNEGIKNLFDKKELVIVGGGGGIPTIVDENGNYRGVDGVIDKDYVMSKIADLVDADILVILTNVDNVFVNFNKPNQKCLGKVTVSEIEKYIVEKQFSAGSMLPKVEAAINFVKSGKNKKAIIAKLENLSSAIDEKSGTIIMKG